jgi:hypothetical protein
MKACWDGLRGYRSPAGGLRGWITRLQEPSRRPQAAGALLQGWITRLQEPCRSPAGMDYEAAGVLQGWMTTLQHLFAQNFFSIFH